VRVCPAIKANGERCRGIVGAGSAYCLAHDPARAKAPAGGPPPKGVKVAAPSPCRLRVVR
jgi:hypothetical protein